MVNLVGPGQHIAGQIEVPVANMGDALRFSQPVFAVPQAFLGPFAFGDVARRVVDQRKAFDLHPCGADLDIDDAAVAAAVPGFERRVARAHFGKLCQQFLLRPLRIPLRHVHDQHFLGGVAEHAAKRVVHLHDIAIEVENVDAVAGGAQQYLVLAADALHRCRRLQGACPGGYQKPGEQRKQQAESNAAAGDDPGLILVELRLEGGLGTHLHRPLAAGNFNGFVVPEARACVAGQAFPLRAIHQHFFRHLFAIVDIDVETCIARIEETRHQIAHAVYRSDPTDEVGAAFGNRIYRGTAFIDRQEHHRAVLHILAGFEQQPDLAGKSEIAGIARQFHGVKALPGKVFSGAGVVPVGKHVVTEHLQVARIKRFGIGNGRISIAPAFRPDIIGRETFLAHRGNMPVFCRVRHDRHEADTLDTGIVFLQPQLGDVVTKFVAADGNVVM